MWIYEKRLEYPINIKRPNARLAKIIASQFGGPDGELSASMRYFSQKFAMPYRRVAGLLNDISTEELAHLEMVGTIMRQLTRNLSAEELKEQNMDDYYVDHTGGVWAQAASGMPFMSAMFQSKGDPIADLHESMAAEQKARTTYENLLLTIKDKGLNITETKAGLSFSAEEGVDIQFLAPTSSYYEEMNDYSAVIRLLM